jgi:hypothetical protein
VEATPFLGDLPEDALRQRRRRSKGVEAFGDQKIAKWGGVFQIGSSSRSLCKLCNKHFFVFLSKLRKCPKIHLEVETNSPLKMKAVEKKGMEWKRRE